MLDRLVPFLVLYRLSLVTAQNNSDYIVAANGRLADYVRVAAANVVPANLPTSAALPAAQIG